MPTSINVDAQGRVVIPLRERERLGVADGGSLVLIGTDEGVLLERRRHATVEVRGGVPVISIVDGAVVSNDEAVSAIHEQRDGR